MRTRLILVLGLALSFGLSGCGDDGVHEGPPDAGGEEGDTSPPTIVSTSPKDGDSGQLADVVVSITFSEPMDKASVEGTLDTRDLGDVTLSWNAAGDTLSITPKAPLAYAEGLGTNPGTVEANAFTVTLGNAAKDLAGNGLGTGTQITFTTLKRISHVFELDPVMTRSMTADEELLFQGDDPLMVGDRTNAEGVRALISFNIGMLPLTTTEIASATLATRQQLVDNRGLPYGNGADDDGLGSAVQIDHVTYSALNNAAFNASQTAHATLGDFCVDGQTVIEIDVTAAVEDDRLRRDTRGDRSQYLLRFPLDNDGDDVEDRVIISRDLMELQVSYLAP